MSYNSKLRKEINKWSSEGIISEETAEILSMRYPDTKRSMTQTLALLGSILLGIGVILFFAANWQAMPKSLKIAVVVLSFTLSYGIGYYLKYVKNNYPKVGYALIFLGSILYGSSIWLIAQIFHLPAEEGMGFFLWYLGIIPMAWLFESSLILVLSLLNLIAWFLMGHYPLGLPYIIFPVLLLLTVIPLAFKKKELFSFTASIVGLYIWFVPLGVKLAGTRYSASLGFTSLLLLSLVLYTLVKSIEQEDFFGERLLHALSLVGLFAGLLPFGFHDFLNEFKNITGLQYFPLLFVSCLAIIIILKVKSKKISFSDLPLLLIFLSIFAFMPYLAANQMFLILNNLLLFIFTLLVINMGYTAKEPVSFTLGLVMFAVAVIFKYFDFFFAMMPRSLFFMSGGILLLLGSLYLEHKRRSILQSMEGGLKHAE